MAPSFSRYPALWIRCVEIDSKVAREAGPMKPGTTVIAFVKDPDGYMIELVQR